MSAGDRRRGKCCIGIIGTKKKLTENQWAEITKLLRNLGEDHGHPLFTDVLSDFNEIIDNKITSLKEKAAALNNVINDALENPDIIACASIRRDIKKHMEELDSQMKDMQSKLKKSLEEHCTGIRRFEISLPSVKEIKDETKAYINIRKLDKLLSDWLAQKSKTTDEIQDDAAKTLTQEDVTFIRDFSKQWSDWADPVKSKITVQIPPVINDADIAYIRSFTKTIRDIDKRAWENAQNAQADSLYRHWMQAEQSDRGPCTGIPCRLFCSWR